VKIKEVVYAYVGGNPISNDDPLGLEGLPISITGSLPIVVPQLDPAGKAALGSLLTQAADNFNNNMSHLGEITQTH
jgi:hypothetical protein